MNVMSISALAALVGSIVGGLTSGATTWMNLRAQARSTRWAHRISRQEELFRDFICVASKTYAEAIQSSEPQGQDLVALYGMISRMRVGSSTKIVACAENILGVTINAYRSPNKTFADIHALIMSGEGMDPLEEFVAAAREELGEFNLHE
jgi:hypothetical protein